MARLSPDDIARYKQLLRAAMAGSAPFAPEAESDSRLQVERGTVLPMILHGASPAELNDVLAPALAAAAGAEHITVVDRAGHTRPAYAGLLVYGWAQAYRQLTGENKRAADAWREPLRSWCEVLAGRVREFDATIGGIPGSRGGAATGAGWAALALYAGAAALGRKEWAELASGFFGRLGAGQQRSGTFLRATPADNPETLWYHELVLLHAAASYAAQSNDALVTAAVMQAADYHAHETQPDHASNQPWGLLAFIWRREARPVADQLLHAVRVNRPAGQDGIASLLLADCLYCLGRL